MDSTGVVEIAHSIQLAVAPVFLLSGVGVVLTVLTNRLARIIDRARLVETRLSAQTEESGAQIQIELRDLSKRAHIVQVAITLCTTCALLICLVIVSLFAGEALARDLSKLIVILFIAGLFAFIGALLAFLLEIRAATATLRFGTKPH
jgi:hypothetical protein